MNRIDLFYSIEGVDEELLERSESVLQHNTRWLKWGALAACFVILAASCLWLLPRRATNQITIDDITQRYRDVTVMGGEEAIIWPWEYQTVYERYNAMEFDGREYAVKTYGKSVDRALIGDKIGTAEARGYDEYSEQEYRQSFDVWQIKGISADLMIATEMEGQFYPFKNTEYTPPTTLGDMLDGYSLPQILSLTGFSVYQDGGETGYYKLSDDDYIWQILDECRDAPFVEDEAGGRILRDRITFSVTSEALGVYKRAFYVSADGYVSTNAFDWAYTFFIGEETAAEVIAYASKNAVKAQREPYTYSLAGTLVEIGNGYILVDDSVLCADEKDGMVFKVLTSDLRISRCIDFQKISVGSLVVIGFWEPIRIEEGNTVSGAVSMVTGSLYEGEVVIPE